MSKVSIVMPSFNYARYLSLSIESILKQSHTDLELVITDDCSTDGSREMVAEWARRDSRVVSVLHDVNVGLAGARNSALAASSGKFIALCDADDLWIADKLKTQLACFRRAPEIGLVHSDSAIMDGQGTLTGQRFSSLMHRQGQKTSGYLFDELCRRNFLCVPTVIVRREAMELAGGFDDRLRSLEDWVCWTRIARKYPFDYVDDALAHYRIHAGGLSSNPLGMARNRVKAIGFLMETFPEIPARAKSEMLYALGSSHLVVDDLMLAARAFLGAANAYPFQLRSWVRCCQALANMALPRRARA
jgi:glycosyltransferase involved in cell wall biosynthesis